MGLGIYIDLYGRLRPHLLIGSSNPFAVNVITVNETIDWTRNGVCLLRPLPDPQWVCAYFWLRLCSHCITSFTDRWFCLRSLFHILHRSSTFWTTYFELLNYLNSWTYRTYGTYYLSACFTEHHFYNVCLSNTL